MSRETTDTSNNFSAKEIPDGTHIFTVLKVTKRYGGPQKDKPFFVWELEYEDKQGEQVLLPNMMGDLLRVLGCKETGPNKFDWDTEDIVNSQFKATVSHSPDKKDPSKIRQEMRDFNKFEAESEIPF